MGDEAPGAVVNLCSLPARRTQRVDVVEEWQVSLSQVRDFRGPVVHLQVDVEVIVTVPRRAHAVVPQPLQIRRQSAWATAGHQQIPAELKIQRFERRIRLAAFDAFQSFVGRQRRGGCWSKPQRCAPEQPLMVGHVIGSHPLVAFVRCRGDLPLNRYFRKIGAPITFRKSRLSGTSPRPRTKASSGCEPITWPTISGCSGARPATWTSGRLTLPTDERLERVKHGERPGARSAVLSVRPLPAHREQPPRRSAGEPAGPVERQHEPAVGQRLSHQHQPADELLAGGGHEPRGDCTRRCSTSRFAA